MFSAGQIISESTLNVRIGSETRLSAAYKPYKIKTLIVHDKYNRESFENDIALLKLKETLSFSESFRAICFSQLVELPEASSGIAVGYGSTEKSTGHSDILHQVEIPIVDQEDCLDSDSNFFRKHLFPGNFCAGQIGVQRGVCSGDSGKASVLLNPTIDLLFLRRWFLCSNQQQLVPSRHHFKHQRIEKRAQPNLQFLFVRNFHKRHILHSVDQRKNDHELDVDNCKRKSKQNKLLKFSFRVAFISSFYIAQLEQRIKFSSLNL